MRKEDLTSIEKLNKLRKSMAKAIDNRFDDIGY